MDGLRGQYSQSALLEAFQMKRSSYNYHRHHRSKINPEQERLKAEVIKIHQNSRGAAGSRTISGKLKAEGEPVGRYKARSLMREAGLESKQPKGPRYKVAKKPAQVADNHLNREFRVTRPNQAWCGDVTYIWAGKCWLYLALVIDLYTRRIVGWACSTSPDTLLTMQALQVAYESRGQPKGVLFHSDQGCHYTSKAFQQRLWQYQFKQSMSRRGNCWDNAPMERCFRSFKSEWMPKTFYSSYQEAEHDIFQYLKYYNGYRVHSYNNYLTPIEAEKRYAA